MADLIAVRPGHALFHVGKGIGIVVNDDTLAASRPARVEAIVATGGWVRPTVFPENVHALSEIAESAAHKLTDDGKRGFRPPKAAKAAAQLALAAGGSPSAPGVAIAQALVAGAGLSNSAIREIATFNGDDALELELRGGDAAREWAASIADKLEVEDNVDDEFAGNYDGVETDWVDIDKPHEFVPAEDFSECFLCDKAEADPIHAVSAAIDMPYPDEPSIRAAMAAYFGTFDKHARATIRANALRSAEELGLTNILPSVWTHTTVLAAAPMSEELPSIGDGSDAPYDNTPVEATDLRPGMFFSKLVSDVSDESEEDDDAPIVVIGLFHKADDADEWHEFDPEDGMWRPCGAPTPDDNMVQLDDDSASQVLDQTSSPEHDNYVELATDESALYLAAQDAIDWTIIDDITMAVDPEYTPEERAKNAARQVRDAGGRFAKAGNRVTKQDGSHGTIKSVNNDGTLEVEDAAGATSKVKASEVNVSPVIARLTEALPLVEDPSAMIDAYEASVAEQRKAGPVVAAGDEPATAVGPDNTDVKPLYVAVVDKNDPAAVLDLIALVPPGPDDKGGALTAWSRKNKQWTPAPKVLEDLRGSTPPPIVQLDDKTQAFVLEQVDLKAAERAKDEKPVAAAGARYPDGAMIALYPPESVTPHLTAIGGSDGEPPEDLHVTLVYFGTVDELGSQVNLDYLAEMVEEFARTRRMRKVCGDISGVGRFSGGDSAAGDPWYASVDAPDLPKLRNDLLDLLDACGVPYKNNHGFTPHITLGYLPRTTSTPVERMDAIPVEFDSISLVLGNEIMSFQLGCDDDERMLWGDEGDILALSAAGGETAHPAATERLRQYWTRGEGAAKIRWGTDGDWTRCYRHLKKYMGVRAKGYCTLRHHDALGYWPGDRDKPGNPKSKKNFSYDDATNIAAKYFASLTAAASPQEAESVESGIPFVIPVLVPEGVPTGDGREFAQGALTTRELPVPLLWQQRTQDGHDESVIVGRIDSIDRLEAGGLGNARGVFDTGEYAQEAIRLIKNKMLRGVSADLDSFEAKAEGGAEEGVPAENGVEEIAPQKMVITSARLMAATLVAKPAFQECRIELVEESVPVADGEYSGSVASADAAALVACATVLSSVPMNPPKSWFENPNLDKPTHLTVDDDGRVYGHIAAWHVDHVGLPFGTKPPRSASNYAYFRTGVVRTAEGEDIPVGQITLTGGHAPLSATASEAVKHYDDTSSALVDVAAGEDKFGIWVAGALRPDVTPQQLRAFRAASPSGDWRPIKGKLELVAVCQVNVPGFPVVRARTASGAVQALVAAGAAELARLREDVDYSDGLLDRVKRLESAESQRLTAQAEELKAKLAPVRDAHNAALVASLKERMAPAKEKHQAELRAQHEALVARMGLLDRPRVDSSPLYIPSEWNEELHPRDEDGKFRHVLARLTDMLDHADGVDDAVADVAKAADAEAVGDKAGAKALGNGAIARLNDAIASSNDSEQSDRLARAVADIAGAVADATEDAVEGDDAPDIVADPLEAVAEWVVKQLEDVSTQPAQAALAKLTGLMTGSGFRDPEDMARAIIQAMKYIVMPNEMPR